MVIIYPKKISKAFSFVTVAVTKKSHKRCLSLARDHIKVPLSVYITIRSGLSFSIGTFAQKKMRHPRSGNKDVSRWVLS